MDTIVKKQLIHSRLLGDEEFQNRCLLKLYDEQEADEQAEEGTRHENGRGFNKTDAPILTPLAVYLISYAQRRGMSPYQAPLSTLEREQLSARLPKYTRQLSEILSDEELT